MPQYTNYEGLHCFSSAIFRFTIQGLNRTIDQWPPSCAFIFPEHIYRYRSFSCFFRSKSSITYLTNLCYLQSCMSNMLSLRIPSIFLCDFQIGQTKVNTEQKINNLLGLCWMFWPHIIGNVFLVSLNLNAILTI
jgi:hypothetical protein